MNQAFGTSYQCTESQRAEENGEEYSTMSMKLSIQTGKFCRLNDVGSSIINKFQRKNKDRENYILKDIKGTANIQCVRPWFRNAHLRGKLIN